MNESTVLVVEDDPDDIVFIQRAFRRVQVSASMLHAADGEQAVEMLSRIEADPTTPIPRAVLLDLKLPRRSGFEVLAWLKSRPGLRRIPVIVLTSSDEDQDLDRAYDLGANSYLLKPVGADALATIVANIDSYWLGLNKAGTVRSLPEDC